MSSGSPSSRSRDATPRRASTSRSTARTRSQRDGWLVKGGGAAHTREKAVAAAADRFVVVVDSSKLVDRVTSPIPLELSEFGLAATLARLGTVTLRDTAARSPDGGMIGDFTGSFDDRGSSRSRLSAEPGVVEHGLFPPELVSDVRRQRGWRRGVEIRTAHLRRRARFSRNEPRDRVGTGPASSVSVLPSSSYELTRPSAARKLCSRRIELLGPRHPRRGERPEAQLALAERERPRKPVHAARARDPRLLEIERESWAGSRPARSRPALRRARRAPTRCTRA